MIFRVKGIYFKILDHGNVIHFIHGEQEDVFVTFQKGYTDSATRYWSKHKASTVPFLVNDYMNTVFSFLRTVILRRQYAVLVDGNVCVTDNPIKDYDEALIYVHCCQRIYPSSCEYRIFDGLTNQLLDPWELEYA